MVIGLSGFVSIVILMGYITAEKAEFVISANWDSYHGIRGKKQKTEELVSVCGYIHSVSVVKTAAVRKK